MPIIHQQNSIDITPEKFLRACSVDELIELELLLSSNWVQHRIEASKRQLTLELPEEK